MDAVETGQHDSFLHVLEETGNTVCGRHPIGVVMAAVEALEKEAKVGTDKVCSGHLICTSEHGDLGAADDANHNPYRDASDLSDTSEVAW